MQPKEPPKPTTVEWRPQFATHVRGEYETREWEHEMLPDGSIARLPMPQTVRMHCEHCGHRWATVCSTGQVRSQIARYARLHLHRDPFAPVKERTHGADTGEDSERSGT